MFWAILLLVLVSVLGHVGRVRIGVLSQPSSYPGLAPEEYSYIQASYIQDLEGAGAEVVPILDHWDNSTIEQVMDHLHGVLLPGGRTNLKAKDAQGKVYFTPYAQTGAFIIRRARQLNRQGRPFVIWGTCLGFEQLFLEFAGHKSSLTLLKRLEGTQNYMNGVSVNETFLSRSAMLQEMPRGMYDRLQQVPLFYFNHKFGIKMDTFWSN